MMKPKTTPSSDTRKPINSSEWPFTPPRKLTLERSGRISSASPPLCAPPSAGWANPDVAPMARTAMLAAIVVVLRRKWVIENGEKNFLFRQSNVKRLMPKMISNISWRFLLVHYGFLSLQQVADYRQSELSCKVVKSRIYGLFAHLEARLPGQTNIENLRCKQWRAGLLE